MSGDERIGSTQVSAKVSDLRARWSPLMLALSIVIVVVAISLPADAIRWMRVNIGVFHFVMGWVENARLQINLVHLVLFLALGFFARLTFRSTGTWQLTLWISIFSLGTEAFQLLIPGREARWEDLVVDIVAGMAGITIGRLLVRGD